MGRLNPDMLAAFRLNRDALKAGVIFLVMNGTVYAYPHTGLTPPLLERYRQCHIQLRDLLISLANT